MVDHRAIELTRAAAQQGVCLYVTQGDWSSCCRLLLWHVSVLLLQGLLFKRNGTAYVVLNNRKHALVLV